MITIEQARAAKEKLQAALRPDMVAVGITKKDDDFAVYVGLYDFLDTVSIPSEIDGVPVVVSLIGEIKPQRSND